MKIKNINYYSIDGYDLEQLFTRYLNEEYYYTYNLYNNFIPMNPSIVLDYYGSYFKFNKDTYYKTLDNYLDINYELVDKERQDELTQEKLKELLNIANIEELKIKYSYLYYFYCYLKSMIIKVVQIENIAQKLIPKSDGEKHRIKMMRNKGITKEEYAMALMLKDNFCFEAFVETMYNQIITFTNNKEEIIDSIDKIMILNHETEHINFYKLNKDYNNRKIKKLKP